MSDTKGFSLLELLVVIVILVIIGAVALPGISGLQSSYRLSKAGYSLADHLALARQTAITRNSAVIVSLCRTKSELGDESFNTVLMDLLRSDGTLEPVGRPLRFPVGFCASTNTQWSSLMTLPMTNVSFRATTVPCRQIRFNSAGGTTLAASSNWFVTLVQDRKSDEAPINFITLAIDPVTGRVFSYQP